MSGEALVNATQLASIFDVSERRIQQLAKEGTIPKGERGKYPLLRCFRAYLRYWRERSDTGGKINTLDEKALLLQAQRKREEMKLAEEQGELIPADEIETLWTGAVAAAKSTLMGWSTKLPEQIAALDGDQTAIAELIKNEIHAALNLLADTGGQH